MHVYAGDVPVASFLGDPAAAAANAALTVAAVNGLPAAQRMAARMSGARAALAAQSRKYDGLARVFRATAGGNAETLAVVYGDTAQLLSRLADNLTDDDPRPGATV